MNKQENTRILIETTEGIKKLCKIITLYNKEEMLYEYKITFPFKNFYFLEVVHFSSIKGMLKNSKTNTLMEGNMEVCYHSKGGISYKNKKAHVRYYKSKPFKQLKKYSLFLRITIGNIFLLQNFTDQKNNVDELLKIDELLDTSFTVDFWLSHYPFQFKIPNKSVLKKNFQYIFEDDKNKMFLLLHFYETTKIDGVYIQIIPCGIINKYRRVFYYYLYVIKGIINQLKLS